MNRFEAGVPAHAEVVQVDGVRLAVHREGKGRPVVCLHAVGHGGRDFEALAAAMKGRHEIIRIDWPGQGRSGPDPQPASAARYALLLEGLLDRLQVRDPLIVGNSIGGAAAILYASRRPVRGLVLCDSGGLVPVSPLVRALCALFSGFFAAGARGAKWFGGAFALYYRMVLPAVEARAQRARIVASGYEIADVLAQAWRSFGRTDADLRAIAQQLDVPVWIAWSRSDRVIPLAFCKPCIRRMRHASLSVFAGGHAAFLEQPREFAEGFRKFAEGLELKAAA